MEHIIKETTEKLSRGTITKDDADKILLDLFNVIGRSEQSICLRSSFCNFKKGICLMEESIYCEDRKTN